MGSVENKKILAPISPAIKREQLAIKRLARHSYMISLYIQINSVFRPELQHETERGNPLLVEQQVCLALLALGSQNYQWSTGLFGKTAQGTAGQCVKRVSTYTLNLDKTQHHCDRT